MVTMAAATALEHVETMRAAVRRRWGAPEDVVEITEVPKPALADDGVLVRVRAASINRADYYAVPDTAQRLVMGSRLERLPAETQCTAFEGSGDFMPALPLDLSQFKPPFSIR